MLLKFDNKTNWLETEFIDDLGGRKVAFAYIPPATRTHAHISRYSVD